MSPREVSENQSTANVAELEQTVQESVWGNAVLVKTVTEMRAQVNTHGRSPGLQSREPQCKGPTGTPRDQLPSCSPTHTVVDLCVFWPPNNHGTYTCLQPEGGFQLRCHFHQKYSTVGRGSRMNVSVLGTDPRKMKTLVHTKTCAKMCTAAYLQQPQSGNNPNVHRLLNGKQNVVHL